ncbi:MAG: Mov34/MPN/PAD-1 family protein, partial [Gemmatimonadota bacterium]
MDQDSKKPAVAPTWVRDAVGSASAEPYHIWKPRPLLRSVLWEPATKGDAPRRSNSAYETFLVQRALDVLFSHVWSSPHETSSFGFLVGDLCECPDSGGRYVIVNTAIPSRFPLKEDAEPQISTEAKIALQLEVDRHKGILVGWYHSHPKGPPRLSNQDLTTHRSIFKEPWHTAVLVTTDPGKPEGAVFCQTDEGMDSQLLPFYEQVSNESLMAKGRKRTRIDWQNFVTDTSILSDIAPRPDVPKPPGEDSKAEEEAAQKAAALEAEQAAEAAQAVAEAEAAKVAEEERARVAAQEAEKAAALEAEKAAQAAEEEAAQKAAALETEQAAEAAQAVAEAEAAKVAEEE